MGPFSGPKLNLSDVYCIQSNSTHTIIIDEPFSCFICQVYLTKVLEDFWTNGKFSRRMGIIKWLVLQEEDKQPQSHGRITLDQKISLRTSMNHLIYCVIRNHSIQHKGNKMFTLFTDTLVLTLQSTIHNRRFPFMIQIQITV